MRRGLLRLTQLAEYLPPRSGEGSRHASSQILEHSRGHAALRRQRHVVRRRRERPRDERSGAPAHGYPLQLGKFHAVDCPVGGEIGVVVAIIGILAGIAVPQLLGAHEKAQAGQMIMVINVADLVALVGGPALLVSCEVTDVDEGAQRGAP